MKRISLQFAGMLTALFLFAFSCQDHYVPEEPEPETPDVLATVKTNVIAGSNPTIITMEILTAGNLPIEEYGIVYSYRVDSELEDINSNPTVADGKMLSSEAKVTGYHLVVTDFKSSNFADMYYRAYLKHTNGAVVYGQVMYYHK